MTDPTLRVVDADAHYVEPADLSPFIAAQYRKVAPRRIIRDDGTEGWAGRDWMAEGVPQFGNVSFARKTKAEQQGLLGISDRMDRSGVKAQDSLYANMPSAAVDPQARLNHMDSEGIDAAMVYPTSALIGIPDPDYQVALNQGLNDWLAEWCSTDNTRLLGATNVVVIHDVQAACNEVRRCYEEYGFRGVFLRTSQAPGETRWWDSTYDPFWATCAELGIGVGLHPHSGDVMRGAGALFDIIGPDPQRVFMRTPFNMPVDAMHALMGIITGGICERFPKLRLGILESSGGWIVPFLERLDSRFEYMGHTLPYLTMQPSEYFQRNWWISFDPDEALLAPSAEWLGADRIIWGSDYPHPDAFYPGFVKMLDGNISALSEPDRTKIRGRNAVDFYCLDTA